VGWGVRNLRWGSKHHYGFFCRTPPLLDYFFYPGGRVSKWSWGLKPPPTPLPKRTLYAIHKQTESHKPISSVRWERRLVSVLSVVVLYITNWLVRGEDFKNVGDAVGNRNGFAGGRDNTVGREWTQLFIDVHGGARGFTETIQHFTVLLLQTEYNYVVVFFKVKLLYTATSW